MQEPRNLPQTSPSSPSTTRVTWCPWVCLSLLSSFSPFISSSARFKNTKRRKLLKVVDFGSLFSRFRSTRGGPLHPRHLPQQQTVLSHPSNRPKPHLSLLEGLKQGMNELQQERKGKMKKVFCCCHRCRGLFQEDQREERDCWASWMQE